VSPVRFSRSRAELALLLLLLAGCSRPSTDTAAFQPVATVGQVMDALVVPQSQALFDAVAYENGQLTRAPRTDDEWHQLQMRALSIAEAGNLLLIAPRLRDTGDWRQFSRAMTTRAADVARAAEARDVDRLLDTGGALYETCTACHQKYVPD
jgi:hypothetical protein